SSHCTARRDAARACGRGVSGHATRTVMRLLRLFEELQGAKPGPNRSPPRLPRQPFEGGICRLYLRSKFGVGSSPQICEIAVFLFGLVVLAEPAGEGCSGALRGNAAEQRHLGELRGKVRTPDGIRLSQVASMRECVRQHCLS